MSENRSVKIPYKLVLDVLIELDSAELIHRFQTRQISEANRINRLTSKIREICDQQLVEPGMEGYGDWATY